MTAPVGGSQVTFTPDLRGDYVIDRWLATGLSEDLTYRFAIEAAGNPPTARLPTDEIGANVNVGLVLDGSISTSPERRALTFKWRLVSRPRDSNTTIDAPGEPIITLVPDHSGMYQLELDVFDGELWSLHPATIDVYAL